MMNTKEKDELFDRKSAQGSAYDKMYFTDDQLKQGAEINKKAAAGEITWDSAHNWWENTRAGYGYSGGEDGHGYTTLANKAKESAPSYIDRYQGGINQVANALLNRKAFTYDPAKDPMYQQYADSYTRQGKQAMEDTLAQVSARTGGLASSYAGTAAQQTYNGYMSALADKVPELRQLAYQMYMDEGDTMRQNLQMLQVLEATEYGRYRDQVADDQWQQEFDTQNSQWQQNFDFEKGLTAASLLAQAGNYSGYKDLFGLSEDDMAALQAGHISEKDLQAAELLAQAGDFSGYQKIFNLSPEKVAKLEKAYQQQNAPKVTGGGGGDQSMTLATAEAMAEQGQFTDDVIRVLRDAGFNDEYLKRVYGYAPDDAKPGDKNDAALDGLYQRIVGYIKNSSKTAAEIATMIEKSALSDERKGELLDMMGY